MKNTLVTFFYTSPLFNWYRENKDEHTQRNRTKKDEQTQRNRTKKDEHIQRNRTKKDDTIE